MQIVEAVSADEINVFERSRQSYRTLAQALPIKDNGELLVNVAANSHIVLQPFWDTPDELEGDLYQPYIKKNPDFRLMLRSSVTDKLNQAAKNLPPDWKLVIKAGYRPLTVQYGILAEVARQIEAKTPGMTKEQAMQHARTFVTDPAIMCPPHCTGAAVDVDIICNGSPVDMGCPPNTDSEQAYTHNDTLTPAQKNNRALLLEAMFAAGFANLAHEWWHFSYGDQYWAAFYAQPHALYAIVEE